MEASGPLRPELCFGTMSFGGDADEATSGVMYKACRDAGINFFDTANEYNKGVSEEILGRLIQGHRNDLVLTTKVNAQIRPDLNARGTSRRHVIEASCSLMPPTTAPNCGAGSISAAPSLSCPTELTLHCSPATAGLF